MSSQPLAWVLCLSALLPAVVGAQDSTCLRRLIPVSFSNDQSLPVIESQTHSLRAELRGKSIPIVSLSPPGQDHRVIMLIDASGSMRDKWTIAMTLALQLAGGRANRVSLALYIFGKDAEERVPFSVRGDEVLDRLRGIDSDPSYAEKHVFGMTATADAILESLKMFGSPRVGDTILLITDDSGDNSSRAGPNALVSDLIADGVRLISIIIPSGPGASVETPIAMPADVLSWASVQTGGFISQPFQTLITARTEGELLNELRHINPDATKLLYAQITESQILEIDLPAPIKKQEPWKLEFANDPSSHKHFIYYPHKLAACGTSP